MVSCFVDSAVEERTEGSQDCGVFVGLGFRV